MARSKSVAASQQADPKASASRAKKISITVDARVLEHVERDARREGKTLSSHISDALARDLRQRRLAALIARYEEEHGAISERELAAARTKWQA